MKKFMLIYKIDEKIILSFYIDLFIVEEIG